MQVQMGQGYDLKFGSKWPLWPKYYSPYHLPKLIIKLAYMKKIRPLICIEGALFFFFFLNQNMVSAQLKKGKYQVWRVNLMISLERLRWIFFQHRCHFGTKLHNLCNDPKGEEFCSAIDCFNSQQGCALQQDVMVGKCQLLLQGYFSSILVIYKYFSPCCGVCTTLLYVAKYQ